MVTLVGIFLAEPDILTPRGTQGPACLPMDQAQRPQLGPFCPWCPLDADNWPECPNRWGTRDLTDLSPLPSLCPLLSPSYPSRFSCPPVLDAGIGSKGLSLSWGLEADHLLLAENSNFLVWFLVGPSSSPPFSGSPGKSPVTPGCLQVAGDVCKATPFAPLSCLLLLSTWLPFLLLLMRTARFICVCFNSVLCCDLCRPFCFVWPPFGLDLPPFC